METFPTRHHTFWPRGEYRRQHEHRFRNQPGLVIPGVPRYLHDQLHYEVPAPPKPTKAEMADISDRLSVVEDRSDRFWALQNVVDYYQGVQGDRAFQARLIARNLIQQMCILTLIEQDAA